MRPMGDLLRADILRHNPGKDPGTKLIAAGYGSLATPALSAPSRRFGWAAGGEAERKRTTHPRVGEGFQVIHTYAVGYYDGSITGGGLNVASDTGLLSGTSGNLSSQYLLTTDFNAIPGTWHAVVFDSDLGAPSANYTAALSSPAYVTDDSFVVEAGAIPEFTTVIAAIVVSGSCFGLYFWMRRRLKFKMQGAN